MSDDVDRDYIASLNRNLAPSEQHADFRKEIAEADRQIAGTKRRIEEAQQKHDHDPAYWGQARRQLERLHAAQVQHRNSLDAKRRAAQPAGERTDEYRPSSGAVWLNEKY